jgi:UDP-N-acetylglucosamine transferase subunit ALG13
MIFATVGAQGPFDRLIRAIDAWAGLRNRPDVFAQIGSSKYRPIHIETTPFINSTEFRSRVEKAQLIVAHAGMGSIITALELGKPIIVMPRRGDLKETRNDHQIATARYLKEQGRVMVAFSEQELFELLDNMDGIRGGTCIERQAPSPFLTMIREFIERGTLPEDEGFDA